MAAAVDPVAAAKTALRGDVYSRRRRRLRREPLSIGAAGDAVADQLLAAPEITALALGSRVAVYRELPTEVPVSTLRRALHERGLTILLPVLLPDNDLDWTVGAVADPALTPAGRPLLLGPAAVTTASVILLPGVAGDRDGNRLGRGGGSYDRALARLDRAPAADRPWTCLLLFEDELVDRVPVARTDVPVAAVVTPARLVRCPVPGGSTAGPPDAD